MLSPRGLKLGAYYIGATPDLHAALRETENLAGILDGFAGRDPLTAGVLIDFRGRQTVDLAVAPFAFSEDGSTVVLENGIVGVFSTDDRFSSLAGSVTFGALSVVASLVAGVLVSKHPGVSG